MAISLHFTGVEDADFSPLCVNGTDGHPRSKLTDRSVPLEFARHIAHAHAMAIEGPDSVHADALEQLFRRKRSSLVAWFKVRVGDPAEAEDLTQESFLRMRQRGDAEIVAEFEPYLFRTAKSVLSDRRRRRLVRHADAHISLEPAHVSPDDADALRTLLARERLLQISEVLMTMPERTRSIFVLCRLEGLRYAEIATRLNISVSAVQKHMLRAIERLMLAGEAPE